MQATAVARDTYTYTVEAFGAAGNHSPRSSPGTAATQAAVGVHHYEYVFPANSIDVYDMDAGMKLVKTISLPAAATDIRGAAASVPTHTLYISYGGDGGPNGTGSMIAYNLLTDTIIWTKRYTEGVDSMAVTPDGNTIYMPTGEASSGDAWNIVDASTGSVTGSIKGGTSPHNTIVSLNGKDVYMGGRNSSYLTVADTATNTVFRRIGPLLNSSVRPFTINGKETLAFTTATGYLGFQVSDITTGKVLYTVPIRGNFPYTPGQPGPSSPSHGISLSPDEKQLWVMDQPNSYVHVFDVSGLPASPPKQVADIKLTRPMTGTQVGCTYDCLREGWLQHSLDGRFVWVGDSGDVISTRTRTTVADLTPLYNSRVYLEIDYSGGVPIATSSRFGVGYVTGVGETTTNAGGTSGPTASPPTAESRPFPKLSALSVSSRMFRAAHRGPSATRTTRLSVRVHFRLNISASARFTIQRVTDGRQIGHRCEIPSRRNRKARHCARYVAVAGKFAIMGHAGNNTFRFSGRLNGHTLSPGHYRLVATPVANSRTGSSQTTSITILS